MSLQLVCLGCLSILFLGFVITQILHLSLRTDHGLFPSRHSQMLLFFLMKTCASHLHFSPSCVPLNTFELVANGDCWPEKSTNPGRNVEIPQISIGHELLHTMVGILAAGIRQNLVEDSMYWSRVTLQTNTERGSVVRDVPFVYITFLVTLLE